MTQADFTIDPEFIAERCRFVRSYHSITQENLAEMSGLSTRSIEKIESGKHTPQRQSLEMIAKAVGVQADFFRKPTPEEEAANERAFKRAMRKTVVAKTYPIRRVVDFMSVYSEWHARRTYIAEIENDDALEIAVGISDYLGDLGCIWDECSQQQRLEYGREIVSMCVALEEHGYLCHMGTHKQRQRFKDLPDLIFLVGVVSFLPTEGADTERYAVIELENGWETVPE